MNRLIENINSINPLFIDQIEPFDTDNAGGKPTRGFTRNIQYFELRPKLWNNSEGISQKNDDVACKVFTHDKSYYPVPNTC